MRGEVFQLRTGGTWYAWAWDEDRRRWLRRSTGCRERKPAMAKAACWLREGEAAAAGLVPARTRLAQQTMQEAVTEFLTSKRTSPKQLTADHLDDTEARLRRVLQVAGWTTMSELTVDGLQAALARLAEPGPEPGEAVSGARRRGRRLTERMSNATLNNYRAAWKAFSRWLHRTGRLPSDPLAFFDRWRIAGNRTFRRRALSHEEFNRLLEATATVPRGGITGADRAMLYLIAVMSGLRRGELAHLRVRDFRLEGAMPNIRLEARWTKNRKEGSQRLPDDHVPALRRWLAGRRPDELVWPRLTEETAALMAADLEAAGIPRLDERGFRVDFHALRTTCGTWLARAGVHPRTAQEVLRHSDVRLTMEHYTDVESADIRSAVNAAVSPLRCAGAARDVRTHEDSGGRTDPRKGAQRGVSETDSGAAQVLVMPGGTTRTARGSGGPADRPGEEAEVGFEPTNNGFAIGGPGDSKSVTEQDLAQPPETGAAPALRDDAGAAVPPLRDAETIRRAFAPIKGFEQLFRGGR